MVFHKDPAMGPSGYARIDADFYPTESWCTEALIRNHTFQGSIWEPACGDGAISTVLTKAGFDVASTDLHNRGFGKHGQNFLEQAGTPDHVRSIITNPPFSDAEKFVRHAINLMEPIRGSVAMLLRHEYDCAAGRVDLFRHPAFALKLSLTKRPRWIAGSTGSPRHNYAWFVWDWETTKSPPTIKWDK